MKIVAGSTGVPEEPSRLQWGNKLIFWAKRSENCLIMHSKVWIWAKWNEITLKIDSFLGILGFVNCFRLGFGRKMAHAREEPVSGQNIAWGIQKGNFHVCATPTPRAKTGKKVHDFLDLTRPPLLWHEHFDWSLHFYPFRPHVKTIPVWTLDKQGTTKSPYFKF